MVAASLAKGLDVVNLQDGGVEVVALTVLTGVVVAVQNSAADFFAPFAGVATTGKGLIAKVGQVLTDVGELTDEVALVGGLHAWAQVVFNHFEHVYEFFDFDRALFVPGLGVDHDGLSLVKANLANDVGVETVPGGGDLGGDTDGFDGSFDGFLEDAVGGVVELFEFGHGVVEDAPGEGGVEPLGTRDGVFVPGTGQAFELRGGWEGGYFLASGHDVTPFDRCTRGWRLGSPEDFAITDGFAVCVQ